MKKDRRTPIIVGLAAIVGELITAVLVVKVLGRPAGGPVSLRPARSASVARARMLADPTLSRRGRT